MHRKKFFGALLLIIVLCSLQQKAHSQTIELLAGNTLNGAMNGTLLGGATMALTNNSDFAPLRIGLGMGTLYGIGMGAYDIYSSDGQKLLVSGTFNDGNNTSIIVLLDTFYGAAAGAVVVTSIMLVANEPLVDGLQYGAGIGAWAGFGFGLFEALTMVERNTSPIASSSSNAAEGFLSLKLDNGKSLGFISPSLIQTYEVSPNNIQSNITASVNLVNFKFNF